MSVKYHHNHQVSIGDANQIEDTDTPAYYVGVINRNQFKGKHCHDRLHNLLKEYCDYVFEFGSDLAAARKKADDIRARIRKERV